MNGNYEFVKHLANDRHKALLKEASVHRLSKQSRGQRETRLMPGSFAWPVALLHQAAQRAANWAAGQAPSRKASFDRPKTAAQ